MKSFLSLIATILAVTAFAVEPSYTIHDKIKGSFPILTNTEAFVSGTVQEARADLEGMIRQMSTNSTEGIEAAAAAGTNYTDKAVGELQTYAVGLIDALAENARAWAEEGEQKAEAAASNNATNYVDSVAAQKHDEFVGILNDKASEMSQGLTNYVGGVESSLSSRINVLCSILKDTIGNDTNKTIRAISAEEVAKIVAEAPESYDTLREIADWILNDTTGAAQMANDIESLKQNAATKNDVINLRLYVDEHISNVYEKAVGYFDTTLAQYDVYGKAASTASNTVAGILQPRPLEFRYDGSGETMMTNAVIVPNWAVSPMYFSNTSVIDGEVQGVMCLYSSSPLRNYSVLVEEVPDGMPYFLVNFDSLKDSHKIYATPAFDDPDGEKSTAVGTSGMYELGWVLKAEDMPCVITLREPEAGILLVRKDKVESN